LLQKKRFLLLLLGSEATASSRVRGYWLAEELIAKGYPCQIVNASGRIGLLRSLIELLRADIIIFQKCYSRWHLYLQKIANGLGKKTILDIDDKYSRIDSQVTLSNISKMMQRSFAVSAGCEALVDFAKPYNDNTVLIPSSIKLKNYPACSKVKKDKVVIGWVGNGNHYYQDLITILLEPLKCLALKHNITFKLIGACGEQVLYDSFTGIDGLDTRFIDAIDWSSSEQLVLALSDIDIGVYPLLDNDFNAYKCAFKALEYMALGIPLVASPVGANCEVIDHGKDGFLASNNEQWVESLSLLIANEAKRKQMGKAGRSKIKKQYSTAIVASKLIAILRDNMTYKDC
jgi:glycosyltransferase involved in cell wall biosynthesis